MRISLRTSVVVENKPGANGQLAAEALKNAAPDGRTLMISPIAVTVFAPLTHTKLRYDPIKDFAQFARGQLPDGARRRAGIAGEDAARVHRVGACQPGEGDYGTPTAGGPPHFFGVMLARATGVDLASFPTRVARLW